MKWCEVKFSTKDGRVRKYEGYDLTVTLLNDQIENSQSRYDIWDGDKCIEAIPKDEVSEFEIHMKEVEACEQ